MFKIKLSGEIGWDVMSFEIEDQLKEANGQDLEIVFNTPGGFISEGNLIDDMILQYKKDFPQSQIMANVIEAQSYGSYLLSNPAFDMIVARTNSVVMIHNPLMGVIGDYKEMRKNADVLERKAAMFAERYSQRMKKSVNDVRSMMDEETYFIGGKEIVESGLADEVVSDKDSLKDSMSLRASAETKIDILKLKIRNTKEDFEKIAAMTKDKNIADDKKKSTQPAQGGNNNNQEEITMKDSNELLEKFPTVHAETMKAGEQSGRDAILKNNATLMEMKKSEEYKDIPEVQAVLDESLEKGRSVEETNPLIMATMVKIMSDPKKAALMRASKDSADDIDLGDVGTVSGEVVKMSAAEKSKKNEEN